jgi:hypothetical protein
LVGGLFGGSNGDTIMDMLVVLDVAMVVVERVAAMMMIVGCSVLA